MPCFHPWIATKYADGSISPRPRRSGGAGYEIKLPCGQCIGCRRTRQRAWTLRILHEAQETRDENGNRKHSSFVTLTYDDEHYKPSLEYRDYQMFMYRLRRRCGPTRFFVCGEYGENTLRPHWHACLFGIDFPEKSPCGTNIYRSPLLEELWPHGFSSIGEITHASAAYVANYCVKKQTGKNAKSTTVDLRTGELVPRTPEMAHMSLRPYGLGAKWFEKYNQEIYTVRDGILQPGGKVTPPPRYYDKLLERQNPKALQTKKIERENKAKINKNENTELRLKVRETVEIAKTKLRKTKI